MRPHLPTITMSRRDFLSPRAPSHRILVTVFLRGGADGLTLVPPTGDDIYYTSRPTLGVSQGSAIALDDYFSLNDALRPLMPYFEDGRLGIVHGCGSEDNSRSHFEAQDFMEHGGDQGSGWLGRYLRARPGTPGALSAVAIGTTRPESLRGAPAGAVMQSVRDFSLAGDDPAMLDQLNTLYANHIGELGTAARDTIAAVKRLRAIRSGNDAPEAAVEYPDTNFARGLREIALLIKAEVGLVATTIDLDGWDTHFVQSQLIGGLMRSLGEGVDAFVRDLGSLSRRVDILIMTEFGRRLRENTSFGTDHGAGGVMMLLGDAAQRTTLRSSTLGGRVTAGFTDLSEDHRDDVGDIRADINYRDVIAPVLKQHASSLDVTRVFPDAR